MKVDIGATGLFEKPIMTMSLKDKGIILSDFVLMECPASRMHRDIGRKGIHILMPRTPFNGVTNLQSVTHFIEEKDNPDLYIEISFTVGQYNHKGTDPTADEIHMILRNIILAIYGKENKMESISEHFEGTGIIIL